MYDARATPDRMPTDRAALSLVLNSHVDVLDYVQVVCDQLCATAHLNEDAGHWVGVSVRESVVNAIRHGNKFDPAKHVGVHFAFVPADDGPDFLEIVITDEGEGFDPAQVPDCTSDERLEVPSGRGVMLMRTFMTRIEYNAKGNRVLMEKRKG